MSRRGREEGGGSGKGRTGLWGTSCVSAFKWTHSSD